MVLPLPLVPFEEYMLMDDRPAYPMNFFIRLRCAGRFDRTALDTAAATAFARHPLLTAIVRPSGRAWVWEPANAPSEVLWLDAPPAEELPKLKPLDVRVEPGLRLAACEGPGRTDLIVQGHHACCDGLGIFRFIEDLLIAYAQARGAAPDSALRSLRPEQLTRRGNFGLTLGKALRMIPHQLRGVCRFLMRTPEPLLPHLPEPDESPVTPDYPAALTRPLEEADGTALSAAARQLQVSTNDIFARDFFLALNDWRQRRIPHVNGGWLRLTVPINLRTMADRRLPAANVVSMVFLDRSHRDMADPRGLLDSIHRRIQRIKQQRLGLSFVLSLAMFRRLPGGLRRMTRAKRCAATAVLTNLGPVLDRCPLPYRDKQVVAGDVVLQSIDALAPLRPLTCAAAAVFLYAGRLHLTMHYDSRVITAADAAELTEEFTRRIRQSAGRAPAVAENVA